MSGVEGAHPQSPLHRRRDELAGQVAELHWNLGGLAYEMAIRDHFRLDVLIRRAAMLQERDAELAEVERMLRMQESGSAGDCSNCGAVRSRGAVFCWQCGAQVMERTVAGENGHHGAVQPTQAQSAENPLDRVVGSPEISLQGGPVDLHGIGRPVQTDS